MFYLEFACQRAHSCTPVVTTNFDRNGSYQQDRLPWNASHPAKNMCMQERLRQKQYIRAPPMEVIESQSNEQTMSDVTVHRIKCIIPTVHGKKTTQTLFMNYIECNSLAELALMKTANLDLSSSIQLLTTSSSKNRSIPGGKLHLCLHAQTFISCEVHKERFICPASLLTHIFIGSKCQHLT